VADLRKAAEMALKALESWQKTCLDCGRASDELGRATAPIQALRQALEQPERDWVGLTQEQLSGGFVKEHVNLTAKDGDTSHTEHSNKTEFVPCKTHPDAPHGFLRNASHSEGRYVCECEYWKPEEDKNS